MRVLNFSHEKKQLEKYSLVILYSSIYIWIEIQAKMLSSRASARGIMINLSKDPIYLLLALIKYATKIVLSYFFKKIGFTPIFITNILSPIDITFSPTKKHEG